MLTLTLKRNIIKAVVTIMFTITKAMVGATITRIEDAIMVFHTRLTTAALAMAMVMVDLIIINQSLDNTLIIVVTRIVTIIIKVGIINILLTRIVMVRDTRIITLIVVCITVTGLPKIPISWLTSLTCTMERMSRLLLHSSVAPRTVMIVRNLKTITTTKSNVILGFWHQKEGEGLRYSRTSSSKRIRIVYHTLLVMSGFRTN